MRDKILFAYNTLAIFILSHFHPEMKQSNQKQQKNESLKTAKRV